MLHFDPTSDDQTGVHLIGITPYIDFGETGLDEPSGGWRWCTREGAWIQSTNGAWVWIDEHASWIQRPGNAERLGVPASVVQALRSVVWDFNGRGRRLILRRAMEAGLIRFRGHGTQCTFESRLPVAETAAAVWLFMAAHCGPKTFVRITDLSQGVMLEAFFEDLEVALQDPGNLRMVSVPEDSDVDA